MRKRILAVCLVAAFSAKAAAEDTIAPPINLHMRSNAHVVTDGGGSAYLPPGWFLDEGSYTKLDTETKRLQQQETRLTAENDSLRKSAVGWQPGWYTVAIAVAGGLALGYELEREISKL